MLEPFFQALRNLSARVVTPSRNTSAQWQATAPVIRQMSFFSATVDKARTLQAYKDMIQSWIEGATEEIDGPFGKATVYKTGGQADFIEQAREFAVKQGLASPEDFKDKRISNIVGSERLKLVFNTNIQQAQRLAIWQSNVSDEDRINSYPAAQFLRSPGATTPRPRHVAAEGEIRRWDDFAFWTYQNSSEIGGFDVPWGPFGFNSYMYQQLVNRKTAERLGLVRPGERIRPINGARWGATLPEKLARSAKAETKKFGPEVKAKLYADLRAQFGDRVFAPDGSLDLARLVKK
jgi:hypothetical protein